MIFCLGLPLTEIMDVEENTVVCGIVVLSRQASLTDEQRIALELMRNAFKNEDKDVFGMSVDDSTYLRYLRARNFDFEKASAMLRATIEWRHSFGLSEMLEGWADVIKLENSTGKMYLRGYDHNGHVLVYMRPRFENTNDHNGNMKHLVYTLERAIACMKERDKDVEKLVLLIDYEGFSLFNAPPMKTSLETLNILQNHYPERLYRAYIIRPPWIFSAFWNMISPFVDPVTREKICFLSSDMKEMNASLKQDIDTSILESDVSGEDSRPFSSEVYLKGDFSTDFLSIIDFQ